MKILFLSLLAGLFFTGCASNDIISHTSGRPFKASTAIASEIPALDVPGEIRSRFGELLNKELYSRDGFRPGEELRIRWSFTEFENGSRALRHFVGFGAGKGKVVVHATFLDPQGREIATAEGEGTVSGGAFGGSKDAALSECAEKIAEYAKANFLVRR